MTTAVLGYNVTKLPPSPSGKTGWPWTPASPQEKWELRQEPPLISIVTPTFNQGQFIEKTIRSVLLQNYPNLQFIIIDGGSTDESVQIISRYEQWLSYWISEKDRGQSDAINKGFRQAGGVLVNWLNSDDYLLPGALHKIASAYLENGGRPCVVVGRCRWIDTKGRVLYEHLPKDVSPAAIPACEANWMPQPAGFFTLQSYWEVGGVSLDLHHAMDFDLYVKLSARVPFIAIDEPVAVALSHDKAKTKAEREKMFAEVRIIQFRNGFESLAREGLERDYRRLLRYQNATVLLRNNPVFKTFNVLSNRRSNNLAKSHGARRRF